VGGVKAYVLSFHVWWKSVFYFLHYGSGLGCWVGEVLGGNFWFDLYYTRSISLLVGCGVGGIYS
jgi:hypothetical protein